MEEQNRGREEVEYEEEVYIHKEIWFTAGTALLMVCLKRAAVVSFIQQWRAWVFLILNIVLLAILFISIRSASSQEQKESKISTTVEVKVERKKMIRKECSSPPLVAIDIDCKLDKSESRMDEGEVEEEEEEVYEECVESAQLSKEELNARVEAFITMFRQHLVSDAKKF